MRGFLTDVILKGWCEDLLTVMIRDQMITYSCDEGWLLHISTKCDLFSHIFDSWLSQSL